MTVVEHAPPKLPAPVRVGQATAVEQTRAAAEVQASVLLAQHRPRDVQAARLDIQNSCQQAYFAEQAFFRYRRGGSTVTGPTVHMARELARCWGNIQYGIAELSRDDEHGQSEMLAFAWDVQTNARASTTFIVPHGRDADGEVKALTALRDIYENNANMGARRVREMIFAVLPPWLIEEAKELCNKTNAGGGDKPLAQRVDEALVSYAGLGVSADRLEQKLGRSKDEWNGYDVAQLRVIYRSIQRREVTVDDEFPPARVTTQEVVNGAAPAPEQQPAEGPDGWPPVAKSGSEVSGGQQ